MSSSAYHILLTPNSSENWKTFVNLQQLYLAAKPDKRDMKLFLVFIYFSVNIHTFSGRNINVFKCDGYTLLGVLHNILQKYSTAFLKSENWILKHIWSIFGF